ncbi:MAG: C4-type zinc ribbon domain-containing protein [Candidatus Magnetominusculus sp. LBB02]|nr:C4-type zinc ribbon domain-containing protein [Candidatus Magnetominusculus sp. LBB02]
MIEELTLLKEMQALDTKIIRLKTLVENAPAAISECDRQYKDSQSERQRKNTDLEKALKQKRDYELSAEEKSEKIKKLRSKSADIKTNKEYQLHLKEVEQLEKEVRLIEDDILIVMEQIERLEKTSAEANKQFAKEEAKYQESVAEVKKGHSDGEKELQILLDERAALVKRVPKDAYNKYMHILERKNALAVVAAKDELCQGCYLNMPPQLYAEVLKGQKIHTCPQCGRMLYFEPESP